MTVDPATVTITLMTQDVDHHHQQQAVTNLVPAEPAQPEVVKPKPQGSSRRGKQYKCGHCHELGHNQKTCPRRASAGAEAAQIQPALGVDASELFGSVANNVAPALQSAVAGNGHTTPIPISRIQPPKLEAALEAAHKRVITADKQVAGAATDQEFEEATSQLDSAVRQLEKVANCAHRCAVVAQTLSGGWDPNATVERESKRIRLDPSTPAALTPTTMALNEAPTAGPNDAVEAGEDGATEAKEEPLE